MAMGGDTAAMTEEDVRAEIDFGPIVRLVMSESFQMPIRVCL